MKFGRDVTLMVLQCRTIWRHRQGVDGVDHNSCLRDCLSFVLLPRTFLDEAITARSSCKWVRGRGFGSLSVLYCCIAHIVHGWWHIAMLP